MEKGYYPFLIAIAKAGIKTSQSTIKMEKGYYRICDRSHRKTSRWSQSTIKMEKGYYDCGNDGYNGGDDCRNPQ